MAIGAVLGLSGAGDGNLAVPALVLGLHWTLPQATPEALLAVGLAAALGAADGLLRRLVRWRAALLMAVLGVAISPIGVRAAHALPATLLTALFAAAMLASSARLIFQSATAGHRGHFPAGRGTHLSQGRCWGCGCWSRGDLCRLRIYRCSDGRDDTRSIWCRVRCRKTASTRLCRAICGRCRLHVGACALAA